MELSVQKKKGGAGFFIWIVVLAALGAAGYFFWTSLQAEESRALLAQKLIQVEAEKTAVSVELARVKSEAEGLEAKIDEMSKAIEDAKAAQQSAEAGLNQKVEELTALKSHYEKRIAELEADVKRYADFSAVLASEMKPIKDVLGSTKPSSIKNEEAASLWKVSSVGVKTDSEGAQSMDLVAGQVVGVNRDFGFIVTNIGSERGAEVGRVIQIYRRGDPLGLGRIERIDPAMSAASVVSSDLMLRVQEGDRVVLV